MNLCKTLFKIKFEVIVTKKPLFVNMGTHENLQVSLMRVLSILQFLLKSPSESAINGTKAEAPNTKYA